MTKRGRFGNVVNAREVPAERWGDETGRFGVGSREVAVALGAKQLGYCVVSLGPGKCSGPFHFHHSEEELFFVLEGRALLRQGDAKGEEQVELGPGDFVAFPAGTGIAHQFVNDGDEPFVYVGVSNRVGGDVTEYPDSDKLLIRSTRLMVRRSPGLDYFDGEI